MPILREAAWTPQGNTTYTSYSIPWPISVSSSPRSYSSLLPLVSISITLGVFFPPFLDGLRRLLLLVNVLPMVYDTVGVDLVLYGA